MDHLAPLHALTADTCARLDGVLCDIDDTLTWHGELVPEAYVGLARLRDAGLKVVPVTGRPGGWVDHIARMWPVDGVVRAPSAFSMTFGVLPSMTATQEFVVPKSMPITLPITSLFYCRPIGIVAVWLTCRLYKDHLARRQVSGQKNQI